MGRTIVTVTSSYSLLGAYKCSKCGRVVRFKKTISSKGYSSRGGITHNDAKLEPYRNKAAAHANGVLSFELMAAIMNVERGNYIDCHLDSTCTCGNVEPWASFRPSLKAVCNDPFSHIGIIVAFILSLVVAFGMLSNRDYRWLSIFLFAIPIGLLIYYAKNNKINDELQDQCHSLPDKSLPHLFMTEDEREGYIALHYDEYDVLDDYDEAQADEQERKTVNTDSLSSGQIQEDNKQSSDNSICFCRKCGFKLLPDSTFCSRCGARVD